MPSYYLISLIFAGFSADFVTGESCIDKFCPPETYCEERLGPCVHPPCRTIFACLPKEVNGCSRLDCPSGKLCVERVKPCISKVCKKIPSCETPETCEAVVCPPSHRCKMDKSGKPACIKKIPPTHAIIGHAILDPSQFNDE